ncbi:hypothetical protein [Anditalea andensis]|uniref:Uncharacterized protein n=1 Tax=Anditalea andensis TaxID=1048983 RepID=A0A074KSW8_9BACT|nr:hypothetical protein [Anditalea andensis]KEO72014.1 hypothetical protein EL17_19035 [Anditalea andensis]
MNSITHGQEKKPLKENGQKVSTKRSFLGGGHVFSINTEGADKQFKFTSSLGYGGIVYDMYVDGDPILESSKGGFFYSAMIIGMAIGIFISIYNRGF